LVGVGVAVLAAVVLGDYPLSGAVPWTAAVVIPAVVGVPMTALAGRHQRALWAATGPLSAGAFGWGVAIATGWGLDPVPTAAWAGLAVTLAWPLALAAALHQRRLTGDAPV
jgi:hypothetical protein